MASLYLHTLVVVKQNCFVFLKKRGQVLSVKRYAQMAEPKGKRLFFFCFLSFRKKKKFLFQKSLALSESMMRFHQTKFIFVVLVVVIIN